MSRGPETPEATAHLDATVDARAVLAAIIDNTSDLVWCVDPERFAIQVSNRALREYIRTGRGGELRVGATPDELLPTPELAEHWRELYRRALRDGPYTTEYDAARGLVLELHFSVLREGERVFGITVFGRDVTERHRATERLRRSEAFFRAIQETSPDLSAVIAPDGRYVFVSPACQHVLGWSVEEMTAGPLLQLVHPDDRDRVERALRAGFATDGSVQRERFRVRRRDGSWCHLEARARNLSSNPAVGGALVNSRDVTEQVELAARVQHVREEEKARIARDLHDDLGQLLTGLKLDLLWLEERLEALPPDAAVGPLVDRAVAASELAEQTIAHVQRLAAELRPAALDRLGLGPALAQEARRFQARTGTACRAHVTDDLAALSAEASTALFRIAQEALTNVARHARASEVTVRLGAAAGGVTLTVEDDGVGIDPARALDSGALGLVGMRERAALEGGEVTVTPRPEGGTRVAVTLPPAGSRPRPV